MNKKIRIIIVAILIAVLLFVGYNTFLAPKASKGEKEVTIQVIAEKEGIDKTFTYNTDHEFLLALLEEHEDELGATLTEYDFGVMVEGMMNYEANQDENEFFLITVNGEEATTGPSEIPLTDGDNYKFELTTY
ncbi:DUF4430 domain-containing protein [Clostridium sp. D2Q-14]|uniref:DUF4430 domain-containing protein n=1 Tax=Anaeromonas gelatinilytica TaxID=2683194 RepID=UPI00193C2EF9|nr:DUF4430 domain-containing protein [Anaeromonas gelatinilytica]MBS4535470.1 DUF4430 domain-containing protein [Anaeromonas gelatinilytica]